LLDVVATTSMFSRITACWLVVLVLAPFTAPFPTCDFATLFGRGPSRQAPIAPPVSAAVSHDDAVVAAPASLGDGRARLHSPFGISPLSDEISSSSATFLRSVTFARDVREDSALNAVLRV
jgi:hypothetical protein